MRLPRILAAVTALLIACSACSGSGSDSDGGTSSGATDSPGKPLSYVALGDSYTAGPQLAQTDAGSGACLRSTRNYPRLVARALKADLTDVSCSGATSDDVLRASEVPAQLDAVTADTRLVTVGIGGNDSGLFSSLSSACTKPGTACADYLDDKVPGILRTTRRHIVSVLDSVKERAPQATVLLVGYLRVAPDGQGCEDLGGTALDARGVSAGEVRIDRTMRAAAKQAGVPYVSMNAESKGHDACAGTEAWTNGLAPELGDGATLHPRAVGMEAVAAAVEKAAA